MWSDERINQVIKDTRTSLIPLENPIYHQDTLVEALTLLSSDTVPLSTCVMEFFSQRTAVQVSGYCTAMYDFENVDFIVSSLGRVLRPVSSFTRADPMFFGWFGHWTAAVPIDVTRPIRARCVFVNDRKVECGTQMYGMISLRRTKRVVARTLAWLSCVARVLARDSHIAAITGLDVLQRVYITMVKERKPRARGRSDEDMLHPNTFLMIAKHASLVGGDRSQQCYWVDYIVDCERQLGYECIDTALWLWYDVRWDLR